MPAWPPRAEGGISGDPKRPAGARGADLSRDDARREKAANVCKDPRGTARNRTPETRDATHAGERGTNRLRRCRDQGSHHAPPNPFNPPAFPALLGGSHNARLVPLAGRNHASPEGAPAPRERSAPPGVPPRRGNSTFSRLAFGNGLSPAARFEGPSSQTWYETAPWQGQSEVFGWVLLLKKHQKQRGEG